MEHSCRTNLTQQKSKQVLWENYLKNSMRASPREDRYRYSCKSREGAEQGTSVGLGWVATRQLVQRHSMYLFFLVDDKSFGGIGTVTSLQLQTCMAKQGVGRSTFLP